MLKGFAEQVWARISGSQTGRFLADVLDRHCRLEGLPHIPGKYSGPTPYHSLCRMPAPAGAAGLPEGADWAAILAPIRDRYPEAPTLALLWICNIDGRFAKNKTKASQLGQSGLYAVDPLPLLMALVRENPPPGAADLLANWLLDTLRVVVASQAQLPYEVREAIRQTVSLVVHVDGADPGRPFGRGLWLMREIAALQAGLRQGGAASFQSSTYGLAYSVAYEYSLPLAEAGLLAGPDMDSLLREFPRLSGHLGRIQPAAHAGRMGALHATVSRVLDQVLARDSDPHLTLALSHYWHFKGIDHFLAACRFIDMHPEAKVPIDRGSTASDQMGWVTHLLRVLLAPRPVDVARAAELGAISAAALQTATLLAPAWAPLADAYTGWPGWAKLVSWLARYGGLAPWSDGAPANQEDEEDGGAVDREALQEAVAAMGEQRFNQLIKHRLARGLYRNGLFFAEAVLGRTAADVEARFLKRDKLAVVALGMLPDEDDILQRYLALRKFAKESRQFGAQRQASETLAVERALANLAATAGYEDRAQLEWSMEARLVEELDPGRRWQVGDYTARLDADESATIRVERDGKLLKSVPPAVRQADAYAEIKEAREQLQAQWDRVMRRLELAMNLGEVMDRDTFAPALITPAGQAMLPNLVLCSWVAGEPVIGFGPAPGAERYQIAHALDLATEGMLHTWQIRLVTEGKKQPFNQLFREAYSTAEPEHVRRFGDRKVRVGTLVEKLKRRGWHTAYQGALVRRLPGRAQAEFWLADGAAYMGALEILTAGSLHIRGAATGRIISEVLRDVDLATRAAAPDQPGPVSPEVLAVRAGLARAYGAAADGEYAVGKGWRLHLGTGAAFDAQGNPTELRIRDRDGDFPYANPDAASADFVARLMHLARRK
ncbi:MAG TPA: DUF5724 domain-containing protein [Symbiobacteriaceae bacterium]|nr:DUF5724 domain-containing protein [Symbiobacteriaceae bacterium]